MKSVLILCADKEQVKVPLDTAIQYEKLKEIILPDGCEPLETVELPEISADILKVALYLVQRDAGDYSIELPSYAEPTERGDGGALLKDKEKAHNVMKLLETLQFKGRVTVEASVTAQKLSIVPDDNDDGTSDNVVVESEAKTKAELFEN